jgi:DNA-binding protein Alba
MAHETTIIIRNRSDKERSIKDAIFAFSGGQKTLLIKGEGQEISTAVEVAEILKNRMFPGIEIANISLGSRPFFNKNRRNNYNNKNYRNNNRNRNNNSNKKDIISKIEIVLKTKSFI